LLQRNDTITLLNFDYISINIFKFDNIIFKKVKYLMKVKFHPLAYSIHNSEKQKVYLCSLSLP